MLTEFFGCGMSGETTGRCPQVELASGGMALEAAVAIRRQIDPEVAALRTAGLVDRARATEPMAIAATGHEAQKCQDLPHGNLRSQLGKVNGWHDQRILQTRPNREEDRVIIPLLFAAVSIWAFRQRVAWRDAGRGGLGTSGPRSSIQSRRPQGDRGSPWPTEHHRGNRPMPRS